ncbi:MAG: tetratricopeptide repeat protein, partial [Salinivirgaceae bacterium]|nr:tetratricopeptide repeat protein [Salinivirgaceae bacterium]
MKIKNLATLIFFVSATATFGQTNAESDDLANQPDGRKSRILLEHAEQNRNTYPTLAREQIAEAIFISQGSTDYETFVNALIIKLKLLCAADSIAEAENQLKTAEKAAKRSGSKELQARATLAQADLLVAENKLDKAAEIYTKLVADYSKSDFCDIAITAANQLGYIYREKSLAEQSQKSFLKAIEIESHSDYPALKAVSLNFLGSHFWRNGNYTQALDYYRQALEIRKGYKNEFDIVNSLINIGNTYQNMGDFSNALTYQTEAMQIAEKWENKLTIAQIM